MSNIAADIEIQGEGSVYLFTPLTEQGAEFLRESVESEPWQWLGHSLAVDHRYAGLLAQAIVDDGLEVA